MRWSLVIVTLCIASMSIAASAETLLGPARVIDGDTFLTSAAVTLPTLEALFAFEAVGEDSEPYIDDEPDKGR